MLRTVGVVLLALAAAGLAVGTFQYTRKKDLVDVGSIRVQAKGKENVVVPPLAAGSVAALGLVLAVLGDRKL